MNHSPPPLLRLPLAILSALSGLLLGGCSVLIGNVRPVEEPAPASAPMKDAQKAEGPLLSRPWKEVAQRPESTSKTAAPNEPLPELSFQNETTGSTIAYTTGCRRAYRNSPPSLPSIAQALEGGLSSISKRQQEPLQLGNTTALKTTLTGKSGKTPVVIQSVLLARGDCIYDLTLVALERHFHDDRIAFEKVLTKLPPR